jgi:uncharacterized delta-60 repeat protein
MKLLQTFSARALRHIRVFIKRTLAAMFALLTLAAMPSTVDAQLPGSLDTATYGPYNGLAYGRFPDTSAHFFRLFDAIVLPDDRVVAGGACIANGATPAGTRFCIAVWSPLGALVSLYVHSSSVNGVNASSGGAIAAQSDGKIVVTAACRFTAGIGLLHFCTARFNADFTSDTSFATGFPSVAPSPSYTSNSFVNSIAIQPDGKIVLGGQCGLAFGSIFCAQRLLANGDEDPAFGGVDSVRTFFGLKPSGAFDAIKRIALAPNGQIYLGGDCLTASDVLTACIARLNADGSIDNTFLAATATPRLLPKMGNSLTSDSIFDMIVQPNGEFIFAGSCTNPGSTVPVPCAMRIVPNGNLIDAGTSYDGATVPTGVYVLREPATDVASLIARVYLQADGKMLALLKERASSANYRVRRYNEDGSIDANWQQPAFDFNAAADAPSGLAIGRALGQQESGKVIAMGASFNSSGVNPQARVIRLNNRPNPGRNCSADIDGDGKVLPTTDGLLLARASLGMTGNAVITGAIGVGASRFNWVQIRDHLIMQCGMTTVRP